MKVNKAFRLRNMIPLLLLFFAFYTEIPGKENWWRVYFSSPAEKTFSGVSVNSLKYDNPENAFMHLLKESRKSFCGAFFEINAKPVIQEIISARDRGVDVKLVIERDNMKKEHVNLLLKAGIPIVTDDKNGFMHNKFAVFDNKVLWTGSYNLTYNDGYRNNNNAIEINSKELSEIYLDEFREMYNQKVFGNKKEYTVFPSIRKKYYVKIGETNINVYFSPEDNIERIILERIKKATQSVYFMAFSFTSDKIGEEMIKLKNRGIEILGVVEKIGSMSRNSEYVKLKLEGIQIIKDKNKYRMHHKVIIIDKKIVITGSYNFSKNANEKNDENIVILDDKEIAELFFKEFLKLIKK